MIIDYPDFISLLKRAYVCIGDASKDVITQNFNLIKKGEWLCVRSTNRLVFFTDLIQIDPTDTGDFDILITASKLIGFLSDQACSSFKMNVHNSALVITTEKGNVKFPITTTTPDFPKFPVVNSETLVQSYPRLNFIKALDFISKFILDSSNSVFETIAQIRNGNVVGGTTYSMGIYKDATIQGNFPINSFIIRKMLPLIKEISGAVVNLYEVDFGWQIRSEGNWSLVFSKMASNVEFPALEQSFNDASSSLSITLNKRLLSSVIKALKHTIDDPEYTTIKIEFFEEGGRGFIRSIFLNSKSHESYLDCDCVVNHKDFHGDKIHFNISYELLLSALKNSSSKELNIDLYLDSNVIAIKEDLEDLESSLYSLLMLRR